MRLCKPGWLPFLLAGVSGTDGRRPQVCPGLRSPQRARRPALAGFRGTDGFSDRGVVLTGDPQVRHLGCDTDAVPIILDEHVPAGDRHVEYCLYNHGAARRALYQYGTPGTRWLSPQLIDAARSAGFELLVIDRPGYGSTSRWPGRRIVDVVDDVRAVLEGVGWERFAVWGGSGGAPHALAIAAQLPHHVGDV